MIQLTATETVATAAGYAVPAWAMIPFAVMLIMIAVGPLLARKWWDKNSHKLFVSLLLGAPVAVFLVRHGLAHELEHQIVYDYLPFVILLLTLYVITGGIHVSGDIRPSSGINTAMLGTGFVLSSFMGTTGAAMLLIRPVLAVNEKRKYKVHTLLFFIALVANCGGLLSPLGDPPLFMLYLRGASFTWFINMLPEWLFTGGLLLLIYYLCDKFYFSKKEDPSAFEMPEQRQPVRFRGRKNFMYLMGVILAVAFINPTFIPQMDAPDAKFWVKFLREFVLLALMGISLYTTAKHVRYGMNKFSWNPILEVAALFLGIFVTMTPALLYMEENAARLGFDEVWEFYFSTGALSSFLDNTPTAVAFHSLASGLPESVAAAGAGIVNGVFEGIPFVAGIPEILLKAISIGAVFFGSLTYIGNGPNFMVKSIAESQGIKMPSFFGYMAKFSLVILLPVYVLLYFIFL